MGVRHGSGTQVFRIAERIILTTGAAFLRGMWGGTGHLRGQLIHTSTKG